MDEATDREIFARDVNWIVFVYLIVILAVVDIVLLLLPITAEAKNVIIVVGIFITLVFWIDSFYWLKRLPGRRYLTRYHGRLAFVGNIPFFAPLRLLQLVLFYKQLRKLNIQIDKHFEVKQNANGVLLLFIFVAIVVFQTASVLVLLFESQDRSAEIITSGDALWWAVVTVATVGYGDLVPVTMGGRITALFLMIVGIGIFGVLTSTLSDWFRRPRRLRKAQRKADQEHRTVTLAEMRQLLEEQSQVYQKGIAELAEKINALERK